MTRTEPMTESELFAKASKLDERPINDLKEALETIWGHGFSDNEAGSTTEAPMTHIFRVDRWLLWTDSQGNAEPDEFPSAEQAAEALERFVSYLPMEDE